MSQAFPTHDTTIPTKYTNILPPHSRRKCIKKYDSYQPARMEEEGVRKIFR
jgi:hypothetical protein